MVRIRSVSVTAAYFRQSAAFRRIILGIQGLYGVGLALIPSPVAAAYAAVDANSRLQLYSIHSPWGSPILSRQRLTHQLALDAFGEPSTPTGSPVNWVFHARLRLDGDYGVTGDERDPNNSAAYIPGLAVAPVDLSYGYLQISGLLRNTSAVSLGRQLFFDELGLWSFDGAKLAFAPGGVFELTGYAGYEQRGGVPLLSTSRYEADGVFRGDREHLPAQTWPGYLNSTALAPAYGLSAQLLTFAWLRARIDYRRVTQHDRVVTLPFADENGHFRTYSASRISSERLGVGLGADLATRASVDGAWVYDLYRRVSQAHRAQMIYAPSNSVRLSAGYDYRLPVFDADSIFNWFGARGSILSRLSCRVKLSAHTDVTVSGGARILGVGPKQFLTNGLEGEEASGVDGLFRVDSTYFSRDDSFGSTVSVEAGDAGKRLVTDGWYRRRLWEQKLETLTQVSAGYWQHPLFPERAQGSILYVLGLRLFPGAKQELGAEWEHVVAEGPYQRFRVLGTAMVRWP